jgi:hypothetical protein
MVPRSGTCKVVVDHVGRCELAMLSDGGLLQRMRRRQADETASGRLHDGQGELGLHRRGYLSTLYPGPNVISRHGSVRIPSRHKGTCNVPKDRSKGVGPHDQLVPAPDSDMAVSASGGQRDPQRTESPRGLHPPTYPGRCGIRLQAACLQAFSKGIGFGLSSPLGEKGLHCLDLLRKQHHAQNAPPIDTEKRK